MSKSKSISAALVFVIATGILLRAQQNNGPVSYFYDDMGRLIRVVDGNGNVATYNYDAVGNITSIVRSTANANALAIFAFTPQQGSVGQTVTIQGQGFSTTAASNTVTFNGIGGLGEWGVEDVNEQHQRFTDRKLWRGSDGPHQRG